MVLNSMAGRDTIKFTIYEMEGVPHNFNENKYYNCQKDEIGNESELAKMNPFTCIRLHLYLRGVLRSWQLHLEW